MTIHVSAVIGALVVALLLSSCAHPSPATATHERSPVAPAREGVWDIGRVEVRPALIRGSSPVLPREFRSQYSSGSAEILFTVTREGTVTDISVVRASPPAFGDLAKDAISGWRYRPARVAGEPVDCRLIVPLSFKVD